MKQIAELLRKGATMLSESCPECNTPLFRLKDGSLFCPMCNKPVVVVSGDAEAEAVAQHGSMEQTLLKKMKDIQVVLEAEKDPERINALLDTLMRLIEAYERLRKLA